VTGEQRTLQMTSPTNPERAVEVVQVAADVALANEIATELEIPWAAGDGYFAAILRQVIARHRTASEARVQEGDNA
jgi:hypothetical protein